MYFGLLTLTFNSDTERRNWFKGADTVSLMYFLENRLQNELESLDNDASSFFAEIVSALSAANKFMKCIYHSSLWLSKEERNTLLNSGYKFSNSFAKCAQAAYDWGLTRFKYQPKFHMFGELLFQLAFERHHNLPSISPLAFCTQIDEDFIGKVAAFSRAVSVRTVHERTLSRYMIALASRW